MTDPIERQHVISIIDNIDTFVAGWRDIAMEQIKQLPSAQPEIIRCRDCKYYTGDYCVRIGDDYGAESFCGFAERREVEHEAD